MQNLFAAFVATGLLTGSLLVMPLVIAPAQADEWSCRNNNAEISCSETACEVTMPDGFTPMDLTLNTSGAVSLCAYSGCWTGQATSTLNVGHYLSSVALQLAWSGVSGSPGDVVATIDTRKKVATVLADGFAHPMTCTRRQ